MDRWIVEPLQFGLELLTRSLANPPDDFLFFCAIVIISIVMSCISQKVAACLAVISLLVLATGILFQPSSIALLVAIESYVASLFVAILVVRSWRRERGVETRLAELRTEVDQLRQAEERRTLVELRSDKDMLRDIPLEFGDCAPTAPETPDPPGPAENVRPGRLDLRSTG